MKVTTILHKIAEAVLFKNKKDKFPPATLKR